MRKTIMFMMALFVSMLCVVPVYAADVEYATVTENTANDSLLDPTSRPVVTGSGTAEVTVTVYGGTYKLLPAQTGVGPANRPDGYTWVGLDFVLPEGSTEVKIGSTSYTDSEEGGEFTFTEWFGFNDELLKEVAKNKENYEKTFTLTWQDEGSESHTQSIKLVVLSNNVVIKEQGGESEVWNEAEYLKESKQSKLDYAYSYTSEQAGFENRGTLYYDEDATKEDVEAQLRELVSSEFENLIIEGIYSDAEMTTPFDFNQDLDGVKIAHIKLVDKVVENEENPSTGDNVLTYAVMGTVALISVLGTAVYFKKVNE